MGAGLAHLYELPNKIHLPAADYLTVQQNYRGWDLLGIVVIGALISTLALAFMSRGDANVFPLTLMALLCIAGSQIVFWVFTYPANGSTHNPKFGSCGQQQRPSHLTASSCRSGVPPRGYLRSSWKSFTAISSEPGGH